jgi:hypothetical protein
MDEVRYAQHAEYVNRENAAQRIFVAKCQKLFKIPAPFGIFI